MIPVAIFLFLVGAVLAWGFRVWVLIPITLLAMIAAAILELSLGASLSRAFGYGLLIGLAPQIGYLFGLFTQNTLLMVRSPLAMRSSRSASVAMLYKQRSIDHTR